MPASIKKFVSVKKAAALTGKSEQKISKLWEAYRNTKFVRRKDGKLYIRADFLRLRFDVPVQPETEPLSASGQPETTPFTEFLQQQLTEKDKQLAARDEQIRQLIERTREQNNIIFSLEQRQQQLESKLTLQLPAQPEKPAFTPVNRFNYSLFALIMLLVGVVLIIFYSLLNG